MTRHLDPAVLVPLLASWVCACATAPAQQKQVGAEVADCQDGQCTGPSMGMPNWECTDGRRGGPACQRLRDRTCGWVVVDCPVAESPPPPPPAPPPPQDTSWRKLSDLPDCPRQSCDDRAPRLPSWTCPDGRQGGPVCKRLPKGTCGWVVIRCPSH